MSGNVSETDLPSLANKPDLLKVKEVAQVFGVDDRTVISWSRTLKSFPKTIRVGRNIFFLKSHLIKFIKS